MADDQFDPSQQFDYRPTGRESAPRALDEDQNTASTEQLLRGLFHNSNARSTAFDEDRVSEYRNIFAIKPTWGISRLRDESDSQGTGAQAGEEQGELRLESGTDPDGYYELRTIEKGQYLSGAEAEVGVGIRIPTLPVDQQFIEWGYFREEASSNGFGFGVDANGVYIWIRRAGVESRVDQADWNMNALDGTDPSVDNTELDLANGYIFQMDFVWYGYGTIEFSVYAEINGRKQKVIVHRTNINQTNSIADPNQPIAVRVDNNGSTSPSSLDVYIGGRQFSVSRSETIFQQREVEEAFQYTLTGTQGVFEPIIGVREKLTFGPSGRRNTVRTALRGLTITASDNCEFRVGFDATTSSGTFAEADGWPADETATEWKTAPFTTSDPGVPQLKGFVIPTGAQGNRQLTATEDTNLVFNGRQEIVLFVAPLTAQDTDIYVTLKIIEQW